MIFSSTTFLPISTTPMTNLECYLETHPNENIETCNVSFKGDMVCDDECNHPEYSFDGGDCCLEFVFALSCTDCFCYKTCTHHNYTTISQFQTECYEFIHPNENFGYCQLGYIGDGYCDQECNHPDLLFDNGDCCLEKVIENYCDDCFCYETCSQHQLILDEAPPEPPGLPGPSTPLPDHIAGRLNKLFL